MPDPQARNPQASRARLPDQGSGSDSRRAQLQRNILRAGELAQQVVCAEFRVQVRMELGPSASRAAAQATAWPWCSCPSG